MRNIIIITLLVIGIWSLVITAPAVAYSSTWTSINASGGSSSNSSYQHTFSAGSISSSKASNSSYSSDIGFISGITATGDASGPLIQDVKADGISLKADDYISSDGTITATITDISGVNTSESYVGYDTYTTYFDDLSGDSSYIVSSGALTYKLNVTTDGDHTFKLHAVDAVGNISSYEVSVKVESGDVRARACYAYPNPYDPSSGNLRLTYMLSADANITVYIFNAINQPVWKRNYASGSEGGHTGYNEITWSGVTDFGEMAGNDVYFARIVAEGKRVIGKVKIAVVR